MSLPINITGTILLFGGALWSIMRFARKREFAYRMWANVLIAAGAVVLATLGSRARLGDTAGLYPAEMVAAALMLAGFLMAGTLDKGTRAQEGAARGAGWRRRADARRGEDGHAADKPRSKKKGGLLSNTLGGFGGD